MKLKEFGPPGEGAHPKFYYVDPPLVIILILLLHATKCGEEGMHGEGGHVWQRGSMHGMGGHAW